MKKSSSTRFSCRNFWIYIVELSWSQLKLVDASWTPQWNGTMNPGTAGVDRHPLGICDWTRGCADPRSEWHHLWTLAIWIFKTNTYHIWGVHVHLENSSVHEIWIAAMWWIPSCRPFYNVLHRCWSSKSGWIIMVGISHQYFSIWLHVGTSPTHMVSRSGFPIFMNHLYNWKKWAFLSAYQLSSTISDVLKLS